METTVTEARSDMRRAYYGGAPGILASALAWSVATGVAALASPQRAIWALLIGGVPIHPVSVLLCRIRGARGTHAKGNPFGQLAGASTFWLIFSLPLAYGLGLLNPAWFFAAMLPTIGGALSYSPRGMARGFTGHSAGLRLRRWWSLPRAQRSSWHSPPRPSFSIVGWVHP